ncbi:MAG: hypothetical protein MPK62_09460 [Alphaproteobacteria bacterium]|nr:hypothetical protein [Alphaproteobacteria bacterium]
MVRLQLEVRNIEDDNTLSREEKEKKIERLERLYHYKHGKVDIEAPPQKKPLKNVNKVFNPHEILDPKDPFITNIIAPIEKFFGDKVNIQFLPGKKKGAYGIVKKVDGKVTIQFTTGRGKETGVKLDTLIHEPGHILYQLAENSKDPQLQAIVGRIKELIVNTEDYADIKRLSKDPNISYSKLSEEGIIQEAFARYFGKHGAKRVRNQGALQSAIAKLLKYVKDKFGVDLNPQKLNLENISDIFLADLLSGEPTLFNLEGDAVNQAFEQAQDTAFEDAYIEKQAGKLQEQRQAQLRDDNRGFWGKAQTNIYNEYILPLKKKKTKDIDKQLESVKTKIKRKTDKGQPVTKFLQNKQKDLLRQRNVIRNQFDNQWYKRKQFLDLIEQEIDRLTKRESVKTCLLYTSPNTQD